MCSFSSVQLSLFSKFPEAKLLSQRINELVIFTDIAYLDFIRNVPEASQLCIKKVLLNFWCLLI